MKKKMIAYKQFVFHQRVATQDCPAGVTVSASETLPKGDFRITEYQWGDVSLWFVDLDDFSADERQSAYEAYMIVKAKD